MHGYLENLKQLEAQYAMPTYKRLPVEFVRGEGQYLWDPDGKKYTDFLSGIGVSNLGHRHPAVVEAVERQLGKLIHSSNLVYNEPALRLAEALSKSSLGGKVFLSNSGAEANEAALKIARKHAFLKTGRDAEAGKVLVASGAFHGRTMGALSATPQETKQAPFAPLVPGFEVVERNDSAQLAQFAGQNLLAILLEPIQGESGVYPLSNEFIETARDLCDQTGALLIFDEVQCGLGRTGTLWAYEQTGVEPDLLTCAKALGGGLPIAAVISKPQFSDVLQPGDHGSTFAGSPLVANAALAALDALSQRQLLTRVRELGKKLGEGLAELVEAGKAETVRGRGLIWAIDLNSSSPTAAQVVEEGLSQGLVLNATGERTLRFLPPFVVNENDIQQVLNFLGLTL